MTTHKLRIPIGELFSFLNIYNINTLATTNRSIKIKNPENKYVPILGFTKKQGDVYKYNLEDGEKFICDEKHLVKRVDGTFIFIKDADYVIKNNIVVKVLGSKIKQTWDYVYDISIPAPHEYKTSCGVVSHNSSLANILVKNLDCEVKYINAAQNNGIDTVREEILSYCTTSSFAKFKIIVLDEFSEFTPQGQLALNAVMEQYSTHVRFILTCNAVENIIEKIRSRCQEFRIVPPSKAQVKIKCEFILKAEKIDYEDEDLDEIIRSKYPDVRKIIQYLNQESVNGSLKLDKEFYKLIQYEKEIVEIIKNTTEKSLHENINKIRQLMADNRVKNFLSVYKGLFEKIDEYCPANKILPVIFTIQDGLKNDSVIADKEINMVATLLKILEIVSQK